VKKLLSISVKQNWIYSKTGDLLFIASPPFLVLCCLLLLDCWDALPDQLSDFSWLLLILAIDVAHVYSSLYRTYFDPGERKKYATLLVLAPITCFALAVFCYGMSPGLFWRVIAYVAVFHFIRQQYGFMRLYSRGETQADWQRSLDVVTIYVLTLYPMWHWHTHTLEISWFTEHDFFHWNDFEWPVAFLLYLGIVLVYAIKELWSVYQKKELNMTKNLIIVGTGLSWYFGIVYFEGDVAFTALNVVSHGVPYMALVWFYKKKESTTAGGFVKIIKKKSGWVFFIISVFLFAYLEETLWDAFVWQEHLGIFPFLDWFRRYDFSAAFVWLVPLLTLPQATHYVLDGFIWKRA
jgi:hypothetical protein